MIERPYCPYAIAELPELLALLDERQRDITSDFLFEAIAGLVRSKVAA